MKQYIHNFKDIFILYILSTCMFVYSVNTVPEEVRRGCQISICVLENKPCPQMLLSTKSSIQPTQNHY